MDKYKILFNKFRLYFMTLEYFFRFSYFRFLLVKTFLVRIKCYFQFGESNYNTYIYTMYSTQCIYIDIKYLAYVSEISFDIYIFK